jgi:hypothetical protein
VRKSTFHFLCPDFCYFATVWKNLWDTCVLAHHSCPKSVLKKEGGMREKYQRNKRKQKWRLSSGVPAIKLAVLKK